MTYTDKVILGFPFNAPLLIGAGCPLKILIGFLKREFILFKCGHIVQDFLVQKG